MDQQTIQTWAPVVFNLIVAAFIYGGLTQRVKNSERNIDDIKSEQDQQWAKIQKHGEEIAGLKARGGKVNGMAAN